VVVLKVGQAKNLSSEISQKDMYYGNTLQTPKKRALNHKELLSPILDNEMRDATTAPTLICMDIQVVVQKDSAAHPIFFIISCGWLLIRRVILQIAHASFAVQL
jgi:hypothetical protein